MVLYWDHGFNCSFYGVHDMVDFCKRKENWPHISYHLRITPFEKLKENGGASTTAKYALGMTISKDGFSKHFDSAVEAEEYINKGLFYNALSRNVRLGMRVYKGWKIALDTEADKNN